MRKTEAYRAVEAVVRSLGVTCANISMRQFIHGVELVYLDPDLLDHVTKKLYPRIAELYPDANGKSVERNLRSARDAIIERADPAHLEKILGYPLRYSLSVGNLLDAICYYLERNGLWPEE